ncbi:MAG: hypothetical protein KUG76_00750 [Gammaproteobacteria bacterium]|nr:hypothetical protein [Gammaproteobacteria bacterium]
MQGNGAALVKDNDRLLAHFHDVPFYVVALCTTADANCKIGVNIPVEQRAQSEVTGVKGNFGEVNWSSEKANAFNPAFDVTPASMVTAWVLDSGVYALNDIQQGILKTLPSSGSALSQKNG